MKNLIKYLKADESALIPLNESLRIGINDEPEIFQDYNFMEYYDNFNKFIQTIPDKYIYNSYVQPCITFVITDKKFNNEFFDGINHDDEIESEYSYLQVEYDNDISIFISIIVDDQKNINADIEKLIEIMNYVLKYNDNYEVYFGFNIGDYLEDQENEEFKTFRDINNKILEDLKNELDIEEYYFGWNSKYLIEYTNENMNKFKKYYNDI